MKEIQQAQHFRKSDDTVELSYPCNPRDTIETALAIHEVKRNHWYQVDEEPAHDVSLCNFLITKWSL